MPLRSILDIGLHGELPQAGLEDLRARLGLQREGRLTDSEDVQFGYRYLRQDRGSVVLLRLLRRDDPGDADWTIVLSCESDPPPESTVRQLRSQVLEAAAALGLTTSER